MGRIVGRGGRWGFLESMYVGIMNRLSHSIELNVFHVNRRPHGRDCVIPDDVAAKYQFGVLTREELYQYSDDPDLDFSRAFVDEALERGDWCMGVLADDRLVAYDWRAISGSVSLNRDVQVDFAYPGQTYGYKMYTHPEFRGQSLQLYSLRHGESQLHKAGHTHTIGYVATQNLSSRRSLAKAPGQQNVGLVGYVRLCNRYVMFHSPGARRYGFRLTPRRQNTQSRPTFQADASPR